MKKQAWIIIGIAVLLIGILILKNYGIFTITGIGLDCNSWMNSEKDKNAILPSSATTAPFCWIRNEEYRYITKMEEINGNCQLTWESSTLTECGGVIPPEEDYCIFTNLITGANNWISGSITFQDLLNKAETWILC